MPKPAIAPELDYRLPMVDPSFSSGAPQRRRVSYSTTAPSTFTLTASGNSGGNKAFQFRIPCAQRGQYYDMRNLCLKGSFSHVGATGASGLSGVWVPTSGIGAGLIRRVSVQHSKQTLYDASFYNQTFNALTTLMSSDAYNQNGVLDQVGQSIGCLNLNPVIPQTGGFTHPLIIPFSCCDKMIPQSIMDGSLAITLYTVNSLQEIGACNTTGGANTGCSVTFSNLELQFDVVEVGDPFYSDFIRDFEAAGSLKLKCMGLDTNAQILNAGSQSLEVSLLGNRVNQLLFWQSLNPTNNEHYQNKSRNGLTQYNLRIGDDQMYPRPQFISATAAADTISSVAESIHSIGDSQRGYRLTVAQTLNDGTTAANYGQGPLYCVNLMSLSRNSSAVSLGCEINDPLKFDLINTASAESTFYATFVKEIHYDFTVGGRVVVAAS